MGKLTRKRYSAEFNAKVALDALKGEQTLAQLAAKHGVHAMMIASWKKQAIEGIAATFAGRSDPDASPGTSPAEVEKLHAKIGQWVVEWDFLVRASGRWASIGGVR